MSNIKLGSGSTANTSVNKSYVEERTRGSQKAKLVHGASKAVSSASYALSSLIGKGKAPRADERSARDPIYQRQQTDKALKALRDRKPVSVKHYMDKGSDPNVVFDNMPVEAQELAQLTPDEAQEFAKLTKLLMADPTFDATSHKQWKTVPGFKEDALRQAIAAGTDGANLKRFDDYVKDGAKVNEVLHDIVPNQSSNRFLELALENGADPNHVKPTKRAQPQPQPSSEPQSSSQLPPPYSGVGSRRREKSDGDLERVTVADQAYRDKNGGALTILRKARGFNPLLMCDDKGRLAVLSMNVKDAAVAGDVETLRAYFTPGQTGGISEKQDAQAIRKDVDRLCERAVVHALDTENAAVLQTLVAAGMDPNVTVRVSESNGAVRSTPFVLEVNRRINSVRIGNENLLAKAIQSRMKSVDGDFGCSVAIETQRIPKLQGMMKALVTSPLFKGDEVGGGVSFAQLQVEAEGNPQAAHSEAFLRRLATDSLVR